MRRLRISAISYLNTAPLMWDFEHQSVGSEFDISYTIPSSCAAALREGTADIGIIPAAAYATISDLVILPGVAIAAQRAVRSILLVAQVPLEQVRTVALDTSSMTSVVLIKILLAKWWGGGRTFTPMAPDLGRMLEKHDAALVIGDPALQIDRARYFTLDLAEEWNRLTGKPFVFAFWALRKAAQPEQSPAIDLPEIFGNSRDHGLELQNLRRIVQKWAPRLNLAEGDVYRYLTENIYYFLDAPCREGLQLFYRYAAEIGALPLVSDLNLLDTAKAVSR